MIYVIIFDCLPTEQSLSVAHNMFPHIIVPHTKQIFVQRLSKMLQKKENHSSLQMITIVFALCFLFNIIKSII